MLYLATLNAYQSQSYILSQTVTILLQTLDSSVQSTIYQVCHKNIHILQSSTYSFYFSLNYMSLRTHSYLPPFAQSSWNIVDKTCRCKLQFILYATSNSHFLSTKPSITGVAIFLYCILLYLY